MIGWEARVEPTTSFEVELGGILRRTSFWNGHVSIIIGTSKCPMCHGYEFGLTFVRSMVVSKK